jgi:predicted PolB exonuclease-like 3'-5' exonuclease
LVPWLLTEKRAVDALGAPHIGSEKALITSFVDRIAELSPQLLVAFNGSSFDLPVFRYRVMVHGVAAPGFSVASILQPLHRGCGRS